MRLMIAPQNRTGELRVEYPNLLNNVFHKMKIRNSSEMPDSFTTALGVVGAGLISGGTGILIAGTVGAISVVVAAPVGAVCGVLGIGFVAKAIINYQSKSNKDTKEKHYLFDTQDDWCLSLPLFLPQSLPLSLLKNSKLNEIMECVNEKCGNIVKTIDTALFDYFFTLYVFHPGQPNVITEELNKLIQYCIWSVNECQQLANDLEAMVGTCTDGIKHCEEAGKYFRKAIDFTSEYDPLRTDSEPGNEKIKKTNQTINKAVGALKKMMEHLNDQLIKESNVQ